MFKKIILIVSVLLLGRGSLAGLQDDLANIAHLSKVLHQDSDSRQNATVFPFPLYRLFRMIYETASQEVKDELGRFFPCPIDDDQTAYFASLAKSPAGSQDASILLSNLYLFSNDKKVKANVLDSLDSAFFKNFVHHIQFSPEKDSIENLNRRISDDHQGEIQDPLEPKNLHNTVAFFVATFFVKSGWAGTFEDSNMLFKTINTAKQVSSFKGNVIVRYHSDHEKTIVHVPASDNIFLAFKMYRDGSVSPITKDELELEGTKAVVSLEIPNFSIENSINLIDKLKASLPWTFAEGFKTLLNHEEVVIEEFLQANKLEVTKSGIKAVSVTKCLFAPRCGGSHGNYPRIDINSPFSLLLYTSHGQDHLPLLDGVVWDLPSNGPALDFDKILSKGSNVFPSIRRPDDTLQRVFFDILMFLFEQRDSGDEWGTKNEILCPLSFLTTLQRAPQIFGFSDIGLQQLQKMEGFSEQVTVEFIDNLIKDGLTTTRVTNFWDLSLSESELQKARKRCLGINDDVIQLMKDFMSTMMFLIGNDYIRNFGLLENYEQVQGIWKFTKAERKQIKNLKDNELRAHFYGSKVEKISNLSLNLLGEDNPKVLYFLKFLFSEVKQIDNEEKLRTAISGSRYILNNIELLKSMKDQELKELFGLSCDEAHGLSESLSALSRNCDSIHSSSASVYPNPAITAGSNGSCIISYIYIGLRLQHISLTSCDVPFNQGVLWGYEGEVTGLCQKNEHATTVALPALGNLVFIMQIKHVPGSPDPLLSFEGASPKTFFISFPEVTILKKGSAPMSFKNTSTAPIHFKAINNIEVKSSIILKFDINSAPRQASQPSEEKIVVDKEFPWAVARVIHDGQTPHTYAIVATGVFNP